MFYLVGIPFIAFVLDIIYKSFRGFILIKKAKVKVNQGDYMFDEKQAKVMQLVVYARVISAVIITLLLYLVVNSKTIIGISGPINTIIYYIIPVIAYDGLSERVFYWISYIVALNEAKKKLR